MLKGYRLRDYDFKLVIMVLALSIIGYLAVGSAKESLQAKQMFGMVAGFVMMIILSLIDYKVLLKLNWFMYIGNLVLLVLVQAIGNTVGGAQRWLEIGGFTFQPSETAKIHHSRRDAEVFEDAEHSRAVCPFCRNQRVEAQKHPDKQIQEIV